MKSELFLYMRHKKYRVKNGNSYQLLLLYSSDSEAHLSKATLTFCHAEDHKMPLTQI